MDVKQESICKALNISAEALDMLVKSKGLSLDNLESITEYAKKQSLMSDRLLDNFNLNLEAFERYYPAIYQKFKSYTVKNSFEFFTMANGVANMQFVGSRTIFYEGFDPKEVCKIQVEDLFNKISLSKVSYVKQSDLLGQIHLRYFNEALKLKESSVTETDLIESDGGVKALPHCLLLGLGLGYILEALYSRIEVYNLVIIEPNSDVFYASLFAFEWYSLLPFLDENNFKLEFLIGLDNKDLFSTLFSYYFSHGRFLAGFNAKIIHYQNDAIDKVVDFLHKDYRKFNIAMGYFDDMCFGISHGIANIKKGKSLVRADASLSDEFKQYPCFVVANGPSLDKDLSFIRKNQDKALIFACGTAIDTLYNAGVKPDFYVAIERVDCLSQTLETFKGTDFLDDIVLVTTSVVHPDVANYFKRTLIYAKSDEPLVYALQRQESTSKTFLNWDALILANPVVANTAVSAAINMGFYHIYLFGVDNGKLQGGEHYHSNSSSFYGKGRQLYERSSNFLYLKGAGNFGGDIETDYIFKLAADYLSLLLKTYKDDSIECINCSDGIALDNTKAVRSYDLDTSSFKDLDKKAFFDYVFTHMTYEGHVDDKTLASLFNKEHYNHFVDEISRLVLQKSKTVFEAFFVMQSISELCASLRQGRDTIVADIIDASSQYFFTLITEILFTLKDEKKALALSLQILKIYSYFLQDSKDVFSHMPNYILGEHLSYTDGLVGKEHGELQPYVRKRVNLFKDNFKEREQFKKRYD